MDKAKSISDIAIDEDVEQDGEIADQETKEDAKGPELSQVRSVNFDVTQIQVISSNYLEAAIEKAKEEKPVSNKKKKLTKKQKKEIKRLKKIDDTKIIMRDHLEREFLLTRETAAKFKSDWEDLIKSIKIVEMREELLAWGQTINRQVQMKDEIVKSMLKDMDNTMELDSKSHQHYCEMFTFVHDSFKACTESIKLYYESEAGDIVENFHKDLNNKNQHIETEKLNFEKRTHALGMKGESILQEDQNIFTEKKEDIVNENIVQRYKLRDDILRLMKALQNQLLLFIKELQSPVEYANHEKKSKLVFNEDKRKIAKMEYIKTQELQHYQKQFLSLELKTERKLNNLQHEYKYFSEVRKGLLNTINEERNEVLEKLKAVTSDSDELIKTYKEIVRQGELLLSLAARCRKMQTQKEKIIYPPKDKKYYEAEPKIRIYPKCGKQQSSESEEDQFYLTDEIYKLRALELKEHLDLSEEELIEQSKLFEAYWRRQALVEAEVMMLQREKDRLTAENKNHIDYIKSLGYTDNLEKLKEFLVILPECQHPDEEDEE